MTARAGFLAGPEETRLQLVTDMNRLTSRLVLLLGILPLLREAGVGADVSARTAAPVGGGLWLCMLLTLLVVPAAYAMWRRHQVRASVVPHDAAAEPGGAARRE
jgi:hypothetical protein